MFDTVFIDRDGVINRKPPEGEYVTRWQDFVFLPGALESLSLLTRAGLRTIIVTNQRGVARGLVSSKVLSEIHERMREECGSHEGRIDAIYVCEHEIGACDCRKPEPGLLLRAKEACPAIDFSRSIVIGDSASDLEAGHRVGCGLVLVGRGPIHAAELRSLSSRGMAVRLAVPSLLDAVRRLLDVPLHGGL